MRKYIDAEAFKRRILSYGTVHEEDRVQIPFYKHYFAEAYVAMLRWVCEEVDDTPAADVVEVRHGWWVVKHGVLAGDGIYGDMGECSVCGLHLRNYEWDYCPNCGAKMDEVEE